MDAWRKLDVDQYDDDYLRPSDIAVQDPVSPEELLHQARSKQGGVRTKLAGCVNPKRLRLTGSGDVAGALSEVLTDPPYGAQSGESRVRSCSGACADSRT